MMATKSRPVPVRSMGAVIHGTSMSRPLTALKPDVAPCTCQVLALMTRPRIPSGASPWMTLWLRVMNAAVLAPTAAAASIAVEIVVVQPRTMGVNPLRKPNHRKRRPLSSWAAQARQRQIAQHRPGANANHQIGWPLKQVLGGSQCNWARAKKGNTDSYAMVRAQWNTVSRIMVRTSGWV